MASSSTADPAIKREVAAAGAAAAAGRDAIAIRHYERAIELHERGKSTLSVPFVNLLCKLFFRYRATGNRNETLRTAERALCVAQSLDQDDPAVCAALARCGGLCGATYSELGRTTEAMAALNSSLALYERLGDMRGIVECLINVATSYRETGRGEAGLELLSRAKALCLAQPAGSSLFTDFLPPINWSIG